MSPAGRRKYVKAQHEMREKRADCRFILRFVVLKILSAIPLDDFYKPITEEKSMRAVVQRVNSAELKVNGELISKVGKGLVVFFGVKSGDSAAQADYLAKKIAQLRIFEDENGKMNRCVTEENGEVLFVSQFTLYGDASHGNRPSFTQAARGEEAEPLYHYAAEKLRSLGVPVRMGVFGADMKIAQENDGPVTILLEI